MDKSRIQTWTFTGFTTPELTDDEVYKSWHRLNKYGALLVAGGQLDQPPEWWDDMELCDAIYNTKLDGAIEEKRKAKT